MTDAGRALVAAGAAPSSTGRVVGLFASDGGVPKLPLVEATVGRRGVAGDRQATRRHHGRVRQALREIGAVEAGAVHSHSHVVAGGIGHRALVDHERPISDGDCSHDRTLPSDP